MKSKDLEKGCASAAVAVAVLLREEDQNKAFEEDVAPFLVSVMTAALNAAVQGTDFPAGSCIFPTKWRYMMGVCYLSRSQKLRSELLKNDIINTLNQVIDTSRSEKRTFGYALTTLWNLSSTTS
eukprot:c11280_g1_i1.p1 GENE.c11280_g1_i1~~c11280_g1_i1.p1  ORF type:complete len:124 (+),score=60.90 c11280_g1_i1:84-455(+)